MKFQDFRTLFMVVTLVLVLLAASPALSLVISIPSADENFSEFWLLGPGHTAEDYPFNVTANEKFSIFIDVANQMSFSQYYKVYVKFGNTTQLDFNSSKPSSLRSLYEFGFFISDEDVWESPVNFAFQEVSVKDLILYVDNVTVTLPIENSSLSVQNVIINEKIFPVDVSTSWDSEKDGFYFRLSFELWRYDTILKNFMFHDRIVGLRLNMTGY